VSAGPNKGSLLSVTVGSTNSMQMGFESMMLKKLHSFLVAADAACSKGDFPVAAVEARLAAVAGLAAAAVPTELAAADPALLNMANGAAQALKNPITQTKQKSQSERIGNRE
jgi:hypothetical protein